MGFRPTKKRDALSWFKLKNYDNVDQLNASEWAAEIAGRLRNLHIVLNASDAVGVEALFYQQARQYWKLIRNYGLEKNIPEDLRPRLTLTVPASGGAITWTEATQLSRDLMLRSMSGGKGRSFSALLRDKAYKPAEINVSGASESPSQSTSYAFLSLSKPPHASVKQDASKKMIFQENAARFVKVESIGSVFLEIDLASSDEQLIDEFKKWLKAQRESQSVPRKSRISKHDFYDWTEKRLLEYFDLVTISALDNGKASNNVIGDLLFPEMVDVDLSERVRKVIKDKAIEVFSIETVEHLLGQEKPNHISEQKRM